MAIRAGDSVVATEPVGLQTTAGKHTLVLSKEGFDGEQREFDLAVGKIVEHGRLKQGAALHQAFAARGVNLAKPIVTTCGSGVTAAVLALAVEEVGGEVAGLYDGSWSEWGARADCPVATGPATTS